MPNRKEAFMPSINGNRKRVNKGLLWFPVLVAGVSAITYIQVIPEPAKLLLLGAFLIGLAFWGKKQLADNGQQDDAQSAERTAQSVEQNQEAASSMRLAAKR